MKKNISVFLSIITFSALNFGLLKALAPTESSSLTTSQNLSLEENERNPFAFSDELESESSEPLLLQSSNPLLEELVNSQNSINKTIEKTKKEFENTLKELAISQKNLIDAEKELADTKKKHINTQEELAQSKEKLDAAKAVVIDHINQVKAKDEEIKSHKKDIEEHKKKLSQKDKEIESHKKDIEKHLLNLGTKEKEIAWHIQALKAKEQEANSAKHMHNETAQKLSQKTIEFANEKKTHEKQILENAKMKDELKETKNTIATLKNHYSQTLQEHKHINNRKIEENIIILSRNTSMLQKRIEEMDNNPNFPKEFKSDIKRLKELISELHGDIRLVSDDISPESPDTSATERAFE